MSQVLRSCLARSAVVAVLLASGMGVTACDRLNPAASDGGAQALTSTQIDTLLAVLAQAPTHGFRAGAFGEQGLAERLRSDPRQGRAQLRAAALAYARALQGQAMSPRKLDPNWGVASAKFDAEAGFRRAATEDRLEAWFESLAPATAGYAALRRGYADYARRLSAGGWPRLDGDGDIGPDAPPAQVAALRQRLAVEDPAAAETGRGDRFDPGLAAAVRRAQQRYGLHTTGIVDADTRAALNVPLEARLAQIRANLERMRWLPHRDAPTRIEANTAAGLVDVYRDGRVVQHMLAAAGKPGDETPILASEVATVVLNPTWNVPDAIADDELLPKGEAYLQRMGFVRNPPGEGVKLTQKPGPDNALGQVKFLFDNPYAVYLHDTPARAAFAREQRSVSHGCVRLARATDLARLLLSNEPGWSGERLDQVLASGETTSVALGRPIPVVLNYLTAFPDGAGGLAFRQDVYGWDAKVLRRLDAQGSSPA